MFSGKTTELLRMVRRERAIGRDVIIVNHTYDSKRSGGAMIQTHSGEKQHTDYELEVLDDVFIKKMVSRGVNTIAINEGQFFTGLRHFITKVLSHKINVIMCGLDSDYKRKPFEEIINVIPDADVLIKTTALCISCNDGTPAIYSMRICSGNERIQVGGLNSYIPVCRPCYDLKDVVVN